MKESTIQKGILDYLELYSRTKPIYYFRAGAGAMKTEHGRYFKTGRPGCPDIVACAWPEGRMIGLEVKTKTGRQSQAQKKAEQDLVEAGGEYHIVRSIADVKRILPLNS